MEFRSCVKVSLDVSQIGESHMQGELGQVLHHAEPQFPH